MAMNRPVRSRMQGGVGRAREKLALTRFKCFRLNKQTRKYLLKAYLYMSNVVMAVLNNLYP